MPPRMSPTVRQQRLGIELRKMRTQADMTPQAMAAALGTDPPKISQMESGKAGISAERLRSWAAASKCDNSRLVDALVTMAQDRGRHWWDEYRGKLSAGFLDTAEMEWHSGGSVSWAITYIPGLLQTVAYAGAIFARARPSLPRHEIDLRTAFRIQRQSMSVGGEKPCTAFIHEAALRMRFGGPAVLRAQLDSLLEDSERPNITVRVVPFDVDTFPGQAEDLRLITGVVPELDTVQVDLTHRTLFIHAEADLNAYRKMIAEVAEVALSPQESRDFIHRIAKELKGKAR
ncbi:helix-turn-helix domain-containing protein [Kitasatospora fiedleri]|uniref:helix-turn-helix domain-containing protein n=1 Tax=Kitasatospora fiedleri TaxID=2991545 RepID=UPI00249A80F4|nr:helix-turn-helix transcriptional regulator [Kitasatospora fiedleri]